MFGLCRSRQAKAREDVRFEMVCEIIRFLGRVEKTPLMLVYTKVIYDFAETLYPLAWMKTRDWRTTSINNADLALAPFLVGNELEIRNWLRDCPEFVFSLVGGLATGKGEHYAWAIAYG